ncbi:MAG: hypothetical protein HW389_3348 [Bacteroidetes bacterium]|nr:hypothetical protein [Bacteroidota bacterium]
MLSSAAARSAVENIGFVPLSESPAFWIPLVGGILESGRPVRRSGHAGGSASARRQGHEEYIVELDLFRNNSWHCAPVVLCFDPIS